MNDEIIKIGTQILKELDEERPTLLRKWMAAYIAEQMEKARSEDIEIARQAGEECSRVILDLWKIKQAELAIAIERGAQSSLQNIYHWGDADYEVLADAVVHPDKVSQRPDDAIKTLILLTDVERDLEIALVYSEAICSITQNASDDAERALEREMAEWPLMKARERLEKVLPFMQELPLADRAETHARIIEGFRALDGLRHVLVLDE